MRVLLNKQEAAALKKTWATAGTTYRVCKQDHKVFEVRRSALRGLVGKRKGTLVKRTDFPRGLRAFPRWVREKKLAPYYNSEENILESSYYANAPVAEEVPVANVVKEGNKTVATIKRFVLGN
jgi:hypothetical protein